MHAEVNVPTLRASLDDATAPSIPSPVKMQFSPPKQRPPDLQQARAAPPMLGVCWVPFLLACLVSGLHKDPTSSPWEVVIVVGGLVIGGARAFPVLVVCAERACSMVESCVRKQGTVRLTLLKRVLGEPLTSSEALESILKLEASLFQAQDAWSQLNKSGA